MHVLVSPLENYLSKLVYISGPYSSEDREQKNANINRAIEAALWCASNGIYYICPHMNSAYMDDLAPAVPTSFYYEMDLAILDRCDAIVLIGEYWKSIGAVKELKYAGDKGLAHFYFDTEQENILKWYREGE